jgi:asparagine synthase (glutamine-hydrolysing)
MTPACQGPAASAPPAWGIFGVIPGMGVGAPPPPAALGAWREVGRIWVQADGTLAPGRVAQNPRWRTPGARPFPGELLGEYALALWDAEAERLTCIRDPFGSRPLFLAPLGSWRQGVAFASDLEMLLNVPGVRSDLSLEALARHLVHPLSTQEEAFFSEVRIVRPGHRMQWSASSGTLTEDRLWIPAEAPPLPFRRGEDAVVALGERISAAVYRSVYPGGLAPTPRPPPDTRWGVHLSGGMDSTAIALHLPHRSPPGVGFTWSPAPRPGSRLDPRTDERARIEALGRLRGLELRFPPGCMETLAKDLTEWVFRDLAVEGTTDLFEEFAVLRSAADLGVTTLLSGWGGNEGASFGGGGLPAYLLARGQFAAFLRTLGPRRGVRSTLRLALSLGVLPHLPARWTARWTDRRSRKNAPWGYAGWTNPYAHPRLRAEFPAAWAAAEPPPRRTDPRKVLQYHLGRPHLARRMETWARWAGPLGIQHRYPLLDLDVVEFMLGLPPELHFFGEQWRGLLWSVIERKIPPDEAPAFPGGSATLSRGDPQNEAKRMTLRTHAWSALAEDPRTDALLRSVPDGWIDAERLRADLKRPAMAEGRRDIPRFKAMRESLRVAGALVRWG